MRDDYGNASEMKVINVTYSAPTVKKINADNVVITEHIWALADVAMVHPAFRK
jgi:hypothetical protein